MLMPTLSVTLIGIAIAVILALVQRRAWGGALLKGFIGAWIGFIFGAFIGGTIDVISGNGVFVAYIGHALACVGAYVAVSKVFKRRPKSAE